MNYGSFDPKLNNLMKTLKSTGICANADEAMARANEMLGAKDSMNGPSPSLSRPSQEPQFQRVQLRNGKKMEIWSDSPRQVYKEPMPEPKPEMKVEAPMQEIKPKPTLEITPEPLKEIEPIKADEPIKEIVIEAPKQEEPKPTFESQLAQALKSADTDDSADKPLIDDEFKKLFSQ